MTEIMKTVVSLREEEIAHDMEESFSSSLSSRACDGADNENDKLQLQWAAIERLPTVKRLRSSLFKLGVDGKEGEERRVVDVAHLSAAERRLFVEYLIGNVEVDNCRLLEMQRGRLRRVGVKLPIIEIRYKNLSVEASCKVIAGKPVPTLWNTITRTLKGFSNTYEPKSKEVPYMKAGGAFVSFGYEGRKDFHKLRPRRQKGFCLEGSTKEVKCTVEGFSFERIVVHMKLEVGITSLFEAGLS